VDGDPAFQWHMDTFELPEDAVLLATNDTIANQALRLGERTWATQFHFEVDRPEIESWIAAVDDAELATAWGRSAVDLRAEAAELGQAHEERGRRIFQRFAELVEAS
jgi:GMP synthase-like glutamine amidotransferase